jgi:hypothetical protein
MTLEQRFSHEPDQVPDVLEEIVKRWAQYRTWEVRP